MDVLNKKQGLQNLNIPGREMMPFNCSFLVFYPENEVYIGGVGNDKSPGYFRRYKEGTKGKVGSKEGCVTSHDSKA